MKKPPPKVAHNQPKFFFSTAIRPKNSPNLNFCFIKIAHRETLAVIYTTPFSQSFVIKSKSAYFYSDIYTSMSDI